MKQLNKFIAPELFAKVSQQTKVTSIVKNCLPIDFATHIQCIGTNGKTLSLTADSSACTSKLRFYTGKMLAALHQNGFTGINAVKIVTDAAAGPLPTPGASQHTRAQPLSARTCAMIHSTAASIRDEKLRDALNRLATVGSKRAKQK